LSVAVTEVLQIPQTGGEFSSGIQRVYRIVSVPAYAVDRRAKLAAEFADECHRHWCEHASWPAWGDTTASAAPDIGARNVRA
jgi:hypothetical protein